VINPPISARQMKIVAKKTTARHGYILRKLYERLSGVIKARASGPICASRADLARKFRYLDPKLNPCHAWPSPLEPYPHLLAKAPKRAGFNS
jgi:hypothetical protein